MGFVKGHQIGRTKTTNGPRVTPLRMIRAKCLDCSCGSAPEVKGCSLTTCALWPYRLGHRPQKPMGLDNQST